MLTAPATVQSALRRLAALGNLLLPGYCPLCEALLRSGEWLCSACREQLSTAAPSACPRCAEPYHSPDADHLCQRCRAAEPPFIWLRAAGLYNDSAATAVAAFKYRGKISLDRALAQLIITRHAPRIREFAPQLIIPVPLHPRRLRRRGYNQALLLARQLGRQLDIPVDHTSLIRTSDTTTQLHLSAQQRLNNLRHAFALSRPLAADRVLLVDDVATTTATLRACCQPLHSNGTTCAAVVIARASI